MTRSRSNRGRRRNRDRSNEPNAQQQEAPVQEAAAPEPEAPQAAAQQTAPPQERRNRRPERGPQARGEDQPREDARPRGPRQGERREDARPGGGRERSGRRRQGGRARQQFQPVTGDVLKHRVQITGDRSPVVKRQITELDTPEGPALGCPMLTRTRLGLPFKGGNQAPRCALAWAIHSETEASYCMETHDIGACWKAHPEHLEEIRQRLAERAAD